MDLVGGAGIISLSLSLLIALLMLYYKYFANTSLIQTPLPRPLCDGIPFEYHLFPHGIACRTYHAHVLQIPGETPLRCTHLR